MYYYYYVRQQHHDWASSLSCQRILPSDEAVGPAWEHPVLDEPAGAELAAGAGVGDEACLVVPVVQGAVVGARGEKVAEPGRPAKNLSSTTTNVISPTGFT